MEEKRIYVNAAIIQTDPVNPLITADTAMEQWLDAIPSKGNAAQNLNLEKEELLVYSCFDFYAKGLEDVRKETGLELLPMLSAVMRLTELRPSRTNTYDWSERNI